MNCNIYLGISKGFYIYPVKEFTVKGNRLTHTKQECQPPLPQVDNSGYSTQPGEFTLLTA